MDTSFSRATGIFYNPAMDPYYTTGLLASMKASDQAIISGVKDTLRSSSDWYKDTALPWLQERLAQGKDFVADFGSGVNDFLMELKPDTSPTPPSGSSPPPQIDYINADLAKAYGMDVTTAYQESLSNTSYQRAVKDLQAAGLNPVLAATGLSGAGGVYGAQKNGSGVTVSANRSSAHDVYKLLANVGTLIGAVAGVAATRSPAGAAAGATAGGKVAGAIGNLFE